MFVVGSCKGKVEEGENIAFVVLPNAGSLCGHFSWPVGHLPTVDSYASSLSLVVDASCSLENTSGNIDVQPV